MKRKGKSKPNHSIPPVRIYGHMQQAQTNNYFNANINSACTL